MTVTLTYYSTYEWAISIMPCLPACEDDQTRIVISIIAGGTLDHPPNHHRPHQPTSSPSLLSLSPELSNAIVALLSGADVGILRLVSRDYRYMAEQGASALRLGGLPSALLKAGTGWSRRCSRCLQCSTGSCLTI